MPNDQTTETLDDAVKAFFLRRYLSIPLAPPNPQEQAEIASRVADIRRIEKQDRQRIVAEHKDVAMGDHQAMAPAEILAELSAAFPDQTLVVLEGSPPRVRVNDVVDYDPTALRKLPPSQRDAMFAASRLPEGTEPERAAKRDALKDLGKSGKMRLRSRFLIAEGRDHLNGLVADAQRGQLDALYDGPDETEAMKFRAWDICNKISQNDTPEVQAVARRKHEVLMKMVLDIGPNDLSHMVALFEFAESAFDDDLAQESLVQARERLVAERADRVRQEAEKPARLQREIAAGKALIDALDQTLAQMDPDDPDKRVKTRELMIARAKLGGQEKTLRDVTQMGPKVIPPVPESVVPTSDDRRAASDAVAARLKADQDTYTQKLADVAQTIRDYVAAVQATGNSGGACACATHPADLMPNAQAAVQVADALKFSNDTVAGYHSQKHFDEIAPADQTARAFGTQVENEVGCYHLSARAAVKGAVCIGSSFAQDGSETHLFKRAPCTAIVRLDKQTALLSTYFNL